ncbi:hypothetical protein Nepgr_011346 [Nepenthes gracilis]|uniref:Uncharacterized protein n=1 Tax=Nepenthes gracilis TaxID=150966 RepID=A0AAD3SF06_NEPGR|nr:hypothetical protein Nepgr_011346 [Nepenthes gracilis]
MSRAISSTNLLSLSTESATTVTQSAISAASLGFIPWVPNSLPTVLEAELMAERATERRALVSISLGLLWISSA